MSKTLTIFTPAYNRAHTIWKTYESLCRQTCKDFEWLIIDDGSSDDTRSLVAGWIDKGIIPIRYIYQENMGMHGAHNTAYKNIHTELNTCIDSDDYMPEDAVEKIIDFWQQNGSNEYAGIIGLDAATDGKIIGSLFPDTLKATTLRDYYEKYGGKGDKKMVYRTDLMQACPEYPVFEGEKYFGLGYKCSFIDQQYKLLTVNEVFVIVDYQADGSSKNMWRQYWNNPRGFSFMRKMDMRLASSWIRKYESCIHYVSHSIRACNRNFIRESPMPFCTVLAIPPGWVLYLYNRYKMREYE